MSRLVRARQEALTLLLLVVLGGCGKRSSDPECPPRRITTESWASSKEEGLAAANHHEEHVCQKAAGGPLIPCTIQPYEQTCAPNADGGPQAKWHCIVKSVQRCEGSP